MACSGLHLPRVRRKLGVTLIFSSPDVLDLSVIETCNTVIYQTVYKFYFFLNCYIRFIYEASFAGLVFLVYYVSESNKHDSIAPRIHTDKPNKPQAVSQLTNDVHLYAVLDAPVKCRDPRRLLELRLRIHVSLRTLVHEKLHAIHVLVGLFVACLRTMHNYSANAYNSADFRLVKIPSLEVL